MPRLDNIRHERFARLIAQGKAKSTAYRLSGYTSSTANATRLWRHKGKASDKIQRRVTELLKSSEHLTAQDILDHLYATFELAFESGQCSAAIKACELIGKEKGLFRDRRENININLASMTWQQTEQYLVERYGDKASSLIQFLKDNYTNPNTNTVTNMPQSVDSRVAPITHKPMLIWENPQDCDE